MYLKKYREHDINIIERTYKIKYLRYKARDMKNSLISILFSKYPRTVMINEHKKYDYLRILYF